jgi:replicative DNA helicase
MGKLAAAPIHIEDTPGLTLPELRSKARRLQAWRGLDVLVVDYLQLIRGRSPDRVQEVSEVARGLKNLAKDLNVPVIALSQLSRAVEGRASKVPQLSDLRESGEIEQAADVVVFIYREELYDPGTAQKGIAELHIAKHRNGPLGVVPLRFEATTTRFQNLTYRAPGGF